MDVRSSWSFTANALLVICSLVVIILIGEAAFRVKVVGSRKPYWGHHPPGLFIPSEDSGYVLTPNFAGQHIHDLGDYDIPISINGYGLRQVTTAIPTHGETAIAIGDSQTFGQGVELEKTWPSLLERHLKRGSRSYSVINAGVPGFGLHQMLARYRQLAHIPHQLVIVGFLPAQLNRLYDAYEVKGSYLVRRDATLIFLDDYVFAAHDNPALGSLNPFINWLDTALRKHSLFFRFVNERLFALASTVRTRLAGNHSKTKGPVSQRGEVQDALRLFEEIKVVAGEHGAKMLVVFMANRGQRQDEIAYYSQIFARSGIYHVDLSKYWEPSWKFAHDMHYNEEGCRRIAEIVYDFLEENKLTSTSARIASANS